MTAPAAARANLQAEQARAAIRTQWPAEFDDGARCGFSGKFEGLRELGALSKRLPPVAARTPQRMVCWIQQGKFWQSHF